MSCKWQIDEVCTNADCPYCADFCPVLVNDTICKYKDVRSNPPWEVEVLKYPTEEDWILCKKCTLVTIGKDAIQPPTLEWKKKLLSAEHSPIRTLQFCFKLTNIPYWVSTHLVRHVHATPFVKTQRNDRQTNYDRENAPQNAPVDMCWYMNAEELITIAHKRLCNQASTETREIVKEICRKVLETNPEFDGLLVPNCIYRNGLCTEFYSCKK